MGIVFRQSFNNTLITYIGFGIGAVNTLFLYTRFLTAEYYGLVGVILSTSAILMPLLAFGVPNTVVKFYSGYRIKKQLNSFLTLMLLLPLALIVPVAVFSWFANEAIGQFLAQKNAIVKDYVWYIFLVGLAMAYFEVFYSWSKVQLKSVFGNFMKEVFVRAGVSLLLLLVYFQIISVEFFFKALVGLYLLRTLLMKLYAYSLKAPGWRFQLPENMAAVIGYSSFMILGASSAVLVLEIDRFMINQFIEIENVAYYSVAIFIATVVGVPSRAMHQITYPLTAELLNKKDLIGLKELYTKSSSALFIISGLIFLLVILNLTDLFELLPETYRGGFTVVFLIGLARVYDALLGNNNAILFNSDYYKYVLVFGVLLALFTIAFNFILIPAYGINGAAMATFLAIFLYNTAKLIFVKRRFGMFPLSTGTFKITGLLVFTAFLFYFLQFSFHPVLNILLKGTLITVMYVGLLYRLGLSDEVSAILDKWLKW